MLSAVAFLPSEIISNPNAEGDRLSVSVVDLDGDGDSDVLSAYPSRGEIAWQKNDGSGDFGVPNVITAGAPGVQTVDATDINGDGTVDILAAASFDDKIVWYANDGTEGFGTPRVIATSVGVDSVSMSDLDNDGDMDVLSVSRIGIISWYDNEGTGEFGEQRVIANKMGRSPSVLAVDMDLDGDLDVITTAFGEIGEIVWFENDGSGVFGNTHVVASEEQSFGSVRSIHAADVDADGDSDIVSVRGFFGFGFVPDDVVWYENTGNGEFGPEHPIADRADRVATIAPADVDADGDVDLFAVQYKGNQPGAIAWYENTGDGDFSPQRMLSDDVDKIWSVYAADVDGDGIADAISASLSAQVAWYRNDASGSIGSEITITKRADGVQSVYAADLDGDGDLDAISASSNDDKVAWHENTGAGSFGPQRVITNDADGATSVFAADINGDGHLDVLSASRNDHAIAWYPNDGLGLFGTRHVITTDAVGVRSVHAADLDGDGDIDILSASTSIDSKISWYENNGFGDFGPEQLITTQAFGAWSIHTADLDADGDVDVLSASLYDDTIAWYENAGSGVFGPKNVITKETIGPRSVYAKDVDGDGNVDVLSASSDGNVSWHKNDGAGEFGAQRVIAQESEAVRSVFAEDLDGDGDVDVISGSDTWVTWHENTGAAVFERRVIERTGRGVSIGVVSVFAADLDRDGDFDILSASRDEDRIAWYDNRLVGDSNDDGVFDSSDLVKVFQAGKYEDDVEDNAIFDEGDWNQDGDFDSADIIAAFQAGRFTFASQPAELKRSTLDDGSRLQCGRDRNPDCWANTYATRTDKCLDTRTETRDQLGGAGRIRTLSSFDIPMADADGYAESADFCKSD